MIICIFAPMILADTDISTEVHQQTDVVTDTTTLMPCKLIVWNDEVNSFDWVIETLMEVCGHTEQQAEQCALIIHFNGKYAVKEGTYKQLKPMCNSITDRGINATIEETVEQ